jgi:hypothetical protein
LVSVAAFTLSKSVKLANLRSIEEKRDLGDPQKNVMWRAVAMLVLANSFSRPGFANALTTLRIVGRFRAARFRISPWRVTSFKSGDSLL